MHKKIAPISYVVTCKYKHNNVGLKILHHKTFSDDDFAVSRKNAFDYVEAAIEFLKNKDLSQNKKTWQNPSGINIHNKEEFDQGIKIYLRINQNTNESEKYLIASYCTLDDKMREKILFGREKEELYWKVYQKEMPPIDEFYTYFVHFEEQFQYLNSLKNESMESIEFVPYDIEYQIETIFECISAFANSSGGKIIFAQDKDFTKELDQKQFQSMSDKLCNIILQEFLNITDYYTFYDRDIRDRKFLEIEVHPTPSPCLFKNEYFSRNAFGNVLDLDKSYL